MHSSLRLHSLYVRVCVSVCGVFVHAVRERVRAPHMAYVRARMCNTLATHWPSTNNNTPVCNIIFTEIGGKHLLICQNATNHDKL